MSYSVEEDWISGISRIPVTYSQPYASTIPFFPPTMSKYVASRSSTAVQPYRTLPWVATFSGCCRQFQSLNASSAYSWSFELTAYVDLTNTRGSPRIVSLPILWIDAPPTESTSATVQFTFCALATAGISDMVLRNGGTLNYDVDNDHPTTFSWFVASGASGVSLVAATAGAASNCRAVRVPVTSNLPNFPQQDPDNPLAVSTPFFNSITVGCSIGTGCQLGPCSYVTADVLIARAPAMDAGTVPTVPSTGPAYTCLQTASPSGLLSAVRGLPLSSAAAYLPGCFDLAYLYGGGGASSPLRTTLELRYVVATAQAQSTELATAPGRLVYSTTLAGDDNAQMPAGARLSAPYGLQDIQVAVAGRPATADAPATHAGGAGGPSSRTPLP